MKLKTRISSALLALTMLFGSASVYAAGEAEAAQESIEIIFTDVTGTLPGVDEGEAKIKVSVSGITGDVSMAQVAMEFSGDLKYKSTDFLKGTNEAPNGVWIYPVTADVNKEKKLTPSIICPNTPIEFSEITDLFIITFEGEPGDTVELTLQDPDEKNTYCTFNGIDFLPNKSVSTTATASDKALDGETATIELVMDVLKIFGGYSSSSIPNGISIKITGTRNPDYKKHIELNDASISEGGHRVNDTETDYPTFRIEETVIGDDEYTVEVYGDGFIPAIISNVTFDEPLVIKNDEFIPGDVNGDLEVTVEDKELCNEAIAENKKFDPLKLINFYDFNRDGQVNRYDLAAFEGIEDDGNEGNEGNEGDEGDEPTATAPAKIEDLKAEGGDKSITLTWTAPANGGKDIENYIVEYGKEDNKTEKKETIPADKTTFTIEGLEDNTTYYFSLTAKNEIGTSEAATASAKTNPPAATAPAKVTGLSSSGETTSSITISWDAPANGGSAITGYKIKYGTSETSLTSEAEITNTTNLEYTISNLAQNTTYYFSVAAVNKVGIGDYSDILSATTNKVSTGGGGGGGYVSGGGGGGGGGSFGGGGGGGGGIPSAPTYYTVTFNPGAGKIASGSATLNVQKNAKPQSVPTVTPPEGKEFIGWSRGADPIDPTKVTVNANITFTALYKDIEKEEKPGTTTPGTESSGEASTIEVFTDISNHAWAKEAIYTLKEKNIINGTSATTFAPANNIKRGDFILILVRMLGIKAEYTENFADVPADSYYAEAIGIAKAAGIAKGSGENFMPEATITRQDLITLAYRAFLAKGFIEETAETTPLDVFADKADISDYAVSAMASMVKAGIINGSDGKVNPKNNATRAEVAVMCARLLGLMK